MFSRQCIEAYLSLDDAQKREYEQILATERYKEVKPMLATTTYEKGIEKGRRETIRAFLVNRFGSLTPAVLQRLEQWPVDRLDELLFAAANTPSLKSLGLED